MVHGNQAQLKKKGLQSYIPACWGLCHSAAFRALPVWNFVIRQLAVRFFHGGRGLCLARRMCAFLKYGTIVLASSTKMACLKAINLHASVPYKLASAIYGDSCGCYSSG